jgi:hypothetical protein
MHKLAGLSRIVLMTVLATAALPSLSLAGDKYIKNEGVKLDPARKPAPGKALIYFVRPQFMGAAVKVKLYAEGKSLGILASKTFIPYECEPGKHEFAAVAENAGMLDATVAADRIYVVQVAIHMGGLKARTHFEVARKGSEALEEYQKARSELVGITATEEGAKWIEEDAQVDKDKMVKYRAKGEVETLAPEDGADALP